MNRKELFENIKRKKSFLCVGLDADVKKIPQYLLKEKDPIFTFNKQIIDATADLCVAYKPNLAFYESLGIDGWKAFEKTVKYIKENYSDQFIIADAKRGDIGNTSELYARSFFEHLDIDSVTVAPYMGEDSVKPFLLYPNKWVIVLGLTSNKGSHDFQFTTKLFEDVRRIVPNHFLLVPGVGAQGGSLREVVEYGINSQCGLLVNSSRQIIYAGQDENFAALSREQALKVQEEMKSLLEMKNLI